jgi:hypothetical protein
VGHHAHPHTLRDSEVRPVEENEKRLPTPTFLGGGMGGQVE